MPTIVDLVRQLEFAAMKQHELHYRRKSSESSERERADARAWNVGCRMELLHAIGQEKRAATAPLLAQIAQLEAQLAEARKDAERYRWLKNECNDKGTTGTYIARELFGFEWNRAIDAAIAQESNRGPI